MAERIRPTSELPLKASVELAFRIAFARNPSEFEQTQMLAFIEAQRSLPGGEPAASLDRAMVEFCQVLLCLNEFVYID